MNTFNIKNKITLVAVAASMLIFSACEKDILNRNSQTQPGKSKALNTEFPAKEFQGVTICGNETTVDLMAGQFTDAGNVSVYNDEDNLYVNYQTEGEWKMSEIHLYVGSKANLPLTPTGNPKIGNFPYKISLNPMVTTYTFVIPLSELEDCFIVAAHAVVKQPYKDGTVFQTETAWGNGTQINTGGSWAMYFDYCKQECKPCEIVPVVFDVFAGQSIQIGNLTVTNDQTTLYVTYNATGDWHYQVLHLYVGTLANLPVNNANTPIPGQFPYVMEFKNPVQSYTFEIPLAGLPDCYILAAHAEAKKIVGGSVVQTETSWSFGTPFPDTPRWGWYSSYCTQYCE